MKHIFSEKNFAAILFVLVLVVFSFAHEDSKKKDPLYQALQFEKRYPGSVPVQSQVLNISEKSSSAQIELKR